jgi:methyl-accepting chemotaxis protein
MFKIFMPASSIGNRLSLGFGALLLLIIVAGYGGISMLDSMSAMAIRARSIALLNDPKEIVAEFKLFEASKAAYVQQQKALQQAMADAEPDGRALVDEIAAAAAKTLPMITLAAQQGQEGSNLDATTTLSMQVRPAEATWRSKIEQLIERQSKHNAEAAATAAASTRQANVFKIVLVAAAILIGVVVGWRITRSVKRPIERIVDVAERIAEGQLGNVLDTEGDDEIGRLLRAIAAMQERLRGLVGEILQTSESIHAPHRPGLDLPVERGPLKRPLVAPAPAGIPSIPGHINKEFS